MDGAFIALREYARSHNRLLADVAAEIAKGSLAAADVLGPRNEA
jgi:hypothetical protein